MVADFSGSVPTIPPDDLRDLMLDPHMAQAMGNGEPIANPDPAVHATRELANRHPWVVLLESLLPWATYGPADEDNPDVHDRDNEEQ